VSTYQALAALQGRDPLEAASKAQDYQLKQRQIQADGPIALLDTVAASANRTGKTRVAMEFKDFGKRKNRKNPQGVADTLYFNAYTEDLFT